MKEICETLFCFWKKCFKLESKKSNQVEYTKMLPKIRAKSRKHKEIFASPPSEKNTLKFKEAESNTKLSILEEDSNTKLSIVEEEIIFPLKYLNTTELNTNFKFEFSKKNLIEFIESEIKDTIQYKSLINKDGFDIYIKESGSIFSPEFPMIKMFYKIPKSKFKINDVNIKLIDKYMNIPEKRISWDTTIKDYKIIKKEKSKEDGEVYLLHCIYKSPMIFVSERDVVEKRYDFYDNDIYYDFSSSVNENYIPLEENIVRMMDHCCVYKMYEEKEEINFISITQVDTKYNLPNAMLSYQLPINYKKWYDSLINSLNEQKIQNDKSEISEQNELDEQSSERLTSSETN